ncbi:MAG: HD domain-containing protein [Bacilli bacterium]|nr:HD domain-containing protein [Bacilli bacterium]
MNFYSWCTILTELMMIAMILHVVRYSGFTKQQKGWFLATFIAIMFCSAAEFAVHCGFYDQSFAIPLTILTVLQFSFAPMLAIAFSGALGLHKQALIASMVFSLGLLIQAIMAPFGLVFYFNESGYFRGNLFFIYEIFYGVSLVYLIVCMLVVGKRFRNRDMITIVMVLIIIIAGIIPMAFFKINITYVAIAISASLCYIYYNDLVQQDIQAEVKENQKRISGMQEHIISGLANLIESRDIETGEHINRTKAYTKILSEACVKDGVYKDQITDHFIDLLYQTAPLHDIGKIVVSDVILRKPARLTPEEYEIMKKHAAVGGAVVHKVLEGVTDDEYIAFASDVATYHHEKWNGEGYPKKLKGEEIPLSARIMALADVFDALVSERCYKKPFPPEEAFAIIESECGTHFDPNLTKVFLNHKDEFLSVLESKTE